MIHHQRVYCRAGFPAAERPFEPWRPAYYAARVTRGNDQNKLCFIGADIAALRDSSCEDGAGCVRGSAASLS